MGSNTNSRKTLQELTFKDNFMFAAVMMDSDIAKGVLERALGMKINHVEVDYEKSIVFNPEYKGIRLDVYIKDSQNTRFNVEMQIANTSILKRSRYYHSQIDMDILETGIDYEDIPNSYVIFICDYDPIGLGKYKYTRHQTLHEDNSYTYDDGTYTVFLSTVGTNDNEVSPDLINFLKYAGSDLSNSTNDYSDEFVHKLQESVERIKFDREMRQRYMLMEEIKKEEYKAGKIETIVDFLSEIAPVPQSLVKRIESIRSADSLRILSRKLAHIHSLADFERELDSMNL